jgi:hypothetical protein
MLAEVSSLTHQQGRQYVLFVMMVNISIVRNYENNRLLCFYGSDFRLCFLSYYGSDGLYDVGIHLKPLKRALETLLRVR